MLSHLVGAANRADIRRLRQLEQEKAVLEEKIERQQKQLREAAVARETTIRELTHALEVRLIKRTVHEAESAPAHAGWEAMAADLQRRLGRIEARAERLQHQLTKARTAFTAESERRSTAERHEIELQLELEAIEASLQLPRLVMMMQAPLPRRRSALRCFMSVDCRHRSGTCARLRSGPARSSCTTMAAFKSATGCCLASLAVPTL
ncbi:MAG: hypothetical protein JO001_10455 [Alphaproteobacteria bacterium]|nr:hypothetical protein [Alphaproteobacteria bacterium]